MDARDGPVTRRWRRAMSDAITAAVIGGLAGSAATFAWELALKPMVAARMLAEVIAADLSLQLQALVATRLQVEAHPHTLPQRKPMPTIVYSALVARLGELPRDVVGETILLYRNFERLNESAERAAGIFEQMEAVEAAGETETVALLDPRLTREIAQYHATLEGTLAKLLVLQPKMVAHAMPWWSVRFWGAPKPEVLPVASVQSLIDTRRAELQARETALHDHAARET